MAEYSRRSQELAAQLRTKAMRNLDRYPASAGTWVHIVRLEGRPEHVCGVYDTIQAAKANKHRHQWNDDEIVSYILNAPPLMHDLDNAPTNHDQL